jgi:hypothetical protein
MLSFLLAASLIVAVFGPLVLLVNNSVWICALLCAKLTDFVGKSYWALFACWIFCRSAKQVILTLPDDELALSPIY